MKNLKKRYWAFVLYPESAPADWLELLSMSGLAVAVSPFHDKDLDPTGEVKKPHYHVILCYSGPTTYNSVKTFVESLNCPIPQPLESVRGYYRYLTHQDNPEKYQYDEKEIKTFGGFDISNFCELSANEVFNIMRTINADIFDLGIYEYCDLCRYYAEIQDVTKLNILMSHTLHFSNILRSYRFKYIDNQNN